MSAGSSLGRLQRPTGWYRVRVNPNGGSDETSTHLAIEPRQYLTPSVERGSMEACGDGQPHEPALYEGESGFGGVREMCARCGKNLTVVNSR